MERIRKGLYQLEAAGWVNAYLIEGARGLTLVDTGHPRSAEKLAKEITEAGFDLREIEQIVITHAHFDHAGGAPFMLTKNRVKVYAHPEDAGELQGKPRKRPFSPVRWLSNLVQRIWFPYRPLEIVVPLNQSTGLRGIPSWQVLHTPGHTPGSISFYQPADYILIAGDAFFNQRGKLTLPPALINDDNAAVVKSVKKLAELPCEVLCCGHGPVIRSGAGQIMHKLAQSLK